MPTTTPRLGLTKPLTSEAYDIAVHNNNMDLLDAAPANATICTSTTRPSTPDDGDLIYETDTTHILIRHSGSWKPHTGSIYLATSGALPASSLTFGKMLLFETDTGRFRVRNSANTAWIFPTAVYVAALSDITSPVTNQLAWNGATQAWVRNDSSGGWVPESGNIVRALYPSQNTALTAAVSSETNIDKLDFVDVTVLNNHRYRFRYNLNLNTSVAGDVFDFRLRKGAALSGTSIQICRYATPGGGGFAPRFIADFYFTATSNEVLTADFRLSVARSGGTGTVLVYQDADLRNYAEMFDMGVVGGGIVTNVAA